MASSLLPLWVSGLTTAFFLWITVPREARPEAECARFTVKIFCRVCGHDLKLQKEKLRESQNIREYSRLEYVIVTHVIES